jgi:hypothetical protein
MRRDGPSGIRIEAKVRVDMTQQDADLFLDWAADAFVAAGRADESEQRRLRRRQAELYYDIFHALNDGALKLPPAQPRAVIGKVLERAYADKPGTRG